jgi:hypothetical protein
LLLWIQSKGNPRSQLEGRNVMKRDATAVWHKSPHPHLIRSSVITMKSPHPHLIRPSLSASATAQFHRILNRPISLRATAQFSAFFVSSTRELISSLSKVETPLFYVRAAISDCLLIGFIRAIETLTKNWNADYGYFFLSSMRIKCGLYILNTKLR